MLGVEEKVRPKGRPRKTEFPGDYVALQLRPRVDIQEFLAFAKESIEKERGWTITGTDCIADLFRTHPLYAKWKEERRKG